MYYLTPRSPFTCLHVLHKILLQPVNARKSSPNIVRIHILNSLRINYITYWLRQDRVLTPRPTTRYLAKNGRTEKIIMM